MSVRLSSIAGMEPSSARALHQLLEPYHAVVYFAPEAKEEYSAAGLKGQWMGYFASRSAPMGAVPAEVVIATFYNFHPNMVRRAIPDAWGFAAPRDVVDARMRVADRSLRRMLGDRIGDPAIAEAASLARACAERAQVWGRPLFAAHLSLAWPDEPHLALWHAASCLREHRGDGHVACLVEADIDGLEAHVLQGARGVVDPATQRTLRGWSEEEWTAAAERLRARGWLDTDDAFTDVGRAAFDAIEERTDELASQPYRTAGEGDAAALFDAMARVLDAMDASPVPFPNPMGLQRGARTP